MVNLSEQKYHLFQLIANIDNPKLLKWLEMELINKQKKLKDANGNHVTDAGKTIKEQLKRPIRQKLDPEFQKKVQGWKGHNEKALMNAIEELNVEEPIEELLALLSE